MYVALAGVWLMGVSTEVDNWSKSAGWWVWGFGIGVELSVAIYALVVERIMRNRNDGTTT